MIDAERKITVIYSKQIAKETGLPERSVRKTIKKFNSAIIKTLKRQHDIRLEEIAICSRKEAYLKYHDMKKNSKFNTKPNNENNT